MQRRQFLATTAMGLGGVHVAGCGGGANASDSPMAQAPSPAPDPTPTPSPTPSPAPAPSVAPLPDWVAKLPLWRWYSIPNTALASVAPPIRSLGNTGPQSKVEAWCGATLKRKGSVYMLGAAGGHADYAGNEVDALALNVEHPQWVQLAPPSPNDQVINVSQYYLDQRPAATHTYYATQFIESQNRMVVMASLGLNGPFPAAPSGFATTFDTRSFSLDLTRGQWDEPDHIAQFPGRGDVFACLCVKHPTTEAIYYSRNYGDGWYRWEPAINRWTRLSSESRAPWFAGSAIDPRRDRMLIVGGYVPIAPEVRDLNGSKLIVGLNGPAATELANITGYPGVTFDEASDRYLVVFNKAGAIRVLSVDAGSWHVSPAPIDGAAPAARPAGLQNAAQYVPELRGIVLANDYRGNVQFLRTSA